MTKIVIFLCRSEHMSPSNRVEKLMSAMGGGGIFCQKLTEADKGGEGSKLTKFWLTSFVNDPLAHAFKFFKSSWRAKWSARQFIALYSRQSSVKRRVVDLTQSGRSLIITKKSNGPNTVP